jgi:ribokinase
MITVMGSFVADLTFRTDRLPAWGETFMGSAYKLGPGGKGSNQAVAAARAGASVSFIGKVGKDPFAELARATYRTEGIDATYLYCGEEPTGAASIVVDNITGENAIIVVPGACLALAPAEVDSARERIAASRIFVTQLELALPTVVHGLQLARSLSVTTILNPAPARELPPSIYACCDYLIPNESEAELLTGVPVRSIEDAERATDRLLARGVGNVVITLGAQGAFVKNRNQHALVGACDAGPVLETTGAGDAFTGGFAVALSEGCDLIQAARFGCAVAGLSVTRHGTAPSMPLRGEIDMLLKSSCANAASPNLQV